jgi:siroheme synthase-like protein
VNGAYPILLDVSDRRILIVGGGAVAVRKAQGVLGAGARDVTCVAPQIHAEMPDAVQKIAEPYGPQHLAGMGLVFAATDSSMLNSQVVADARARRILVSRADTDDDSPGDFSVPARLDIGPVVVTVSAGSPALAVRIRDGLSARFDSRWTAMAEAMQHLRPIIRDKAKLSPGRRREVFRDLAGDEAMDVLASGGLEELHRWLAGRHPELEPCLR